jgi:hypothetical protein
VAKGRARSLFGGSAAPLGANPSGLRGRRPSKPGFFAILAFVAVVAVPAAGWMNGRAAPAAAAADPTIVAAGDIACDPGNKNFNSGSGQAGVCQQKATYTLIANMNPAPAAVLPLGDTQYYCGGYQAYLNSYALSWGKLLDKTYPAVGNHEYLTGPGSDGIGTGCDSTNANASGYFQYYAGAANEGAVGDGWYSFDVGSWHLIGINSSCPGGCSTTSRQGVWLANDLSAHKNQCIAAFWHIPLWSSGGRAASNTSSIVTQLYNAHADVILAGHDHIYERFAQQNASGKADLNGIREFIAGTGGANHTSIATVAANSELRNTTDYGVLKLTLHSGSYDWSFINVAGTSLDAGSNACHNTGSVGSPPPAPTLALTETDATDSVSGSTVYTRKGAAGSFIVTATSSGATSMNFPVLPGMTGGGADSSSPFATTYNWTSTSTASGQFGVTATGSGGTSAATSFTVTPDATSPTTSASCLPSTCSARSGSTVSMSLASLDGESGVKSIYYTTDGTTPTTASPVYSSPLAVTPGALVRYFAVDNVGNQEAAKGQPTTLDTGSGGGAITLQQQKTGSTSSSGALTLTLPATRAGDALVATVAIAAGSTGALASVTDSTGATWVKGPIGFLTGSNTRVEMWYRLGAQSATSVTASFAVGTKHPLAMNVSEWSGVASAGALDGSASGKGTSATAATPSLTTSNASDVVIGAVNYTGSATSTVGSASFTALGNFDAGTSHGRLAYLPTSATGSYQASWTLSASSSYGSAILALEAGAAAPGDTAPPTTSISCNGGSCAGTFSATVTVTLSASDTGGSGVAATYYTTDGSDPASSSTKTTYSTGFSVSKTTTVRFYSIDNAGNAEATHSQNVTVSAPDTTPPSTSMTCNGGSCARTFSGSVAVALTATDTGGSGIGPTYYTTDDSDPSVVGGPGRKTYTGTPFTLMTSSNVKFYSVDNAGNAEQVHTQAVTIDSTPPVTTMTCNGDSCGPGTFAVAVSVTLAAADSGSGTQATYYTTDGSDPSDSRNSARTAYTGTPFTLSASATVRFYSIDNVGNSETVKSQAVSISIPDSTAPSTSMTCNGGSCATALASPVTVALSASDTGGSGLKSTYYTTDGTDPATSSTAVTYTSAFSITSTTNFKFSSVDNANNVEHAQSQTVTVDSTPPVTTISCNGVACDTGTYSAAVSVALPATDDGSGVQATYYTTDGSDPSAIGNAARTTYTGTPFTLSASATVEFYSVDKVGNSEAIQSQAVNIDIPTPQDTTPPSTSISCNGGSCSGSLGAPVSVALSAVDTGGSGVSATYYTLDRTDPSDPLNPARQTYLTPFALSGTTTVSVSSIDNANNVEQTHSQTVTVDSTPPVTTISCNGLACDSGAYTASVSVALPATDGGAGVQATYYTTDGSDPSVIGNAARATYTGTPFTLSASATVEFYSVDKVGNSETVQSQAVNIDITPPQDTTPPSTSINCNGGPCASSYSGTVSVTLAATDDASGVAETYYTTDGSDPALGGPNTSTYTGAFNIASTQTVEFYSVDVAGNAEATQSKLITVASGGGGITLASQKVVASTGSVGSLTANIPTTSAGNALVAVVAVYSGSTGPIASVADSSGATWTKGPIGYLTGSNTRVEIWYRLGSTSVTAVTASFASGTTKSVAMNVTEWAGVASALALDRSGNGNGTSATSASTPALSTSAADLVLGAISYPGSASSTLVAPAFTGLSNFDTTIHGRAAYTITSTAGSVQALWNLSAAANYGSAILALKGS